MVGVGCLVLLQSVVRIFCGDDVPSESVRWLVKSNQLSEAEKILTQIGGAGTHNLN
jgi:hypothetical protein